MSAAPKLLAVVLAAGASRRLGHPKQLLAHRGKPLVRGAVEAALGSGCDGALAVVGAREAEVRKALLGAPISIVTNEQWAEGVASSIRAGVAWAAERKYDGVLLAVCDQPALSAEHLGRLVALFRNGTPIAASKYAGAVGVPAVFHRDAFGALLRLEGNEGAKRVLSACGAVVIDWPEGAFDIDTPEEAALLADGTSDACLRPAR